MDWNQITALTTGFLGAFHSLPLLPFSRGHFFAWLMLRYIIGGHSLNAACMCLLLQLLPAGRLYFNDLNYWPARVMPACAPMALPLIWRRFGMGYNAPMALPTFFILSLQVLR